MFNILLYFSAYHDHSRFSLSIHLSVKLFDVFITFIFAVMTPPPQPSKNRPEYTVGYAIDSL